MGNSRMKDCFDLRHLSATLSFDGQTLARAIQATFERRRMPLPREVHTGLTTAFGDDPVKQVQWKAFLGKLRLDAMTMPLDLVVEKLRSFLMPPVEAPTRRWSGSRPSREVGLPVDHGGDVPPRTSRAPSSLDTAPAKGDPGPPWPQEHTVLAGLRRGAGSGPGVRTAPSFASRLTVG